MNDIVRMHDALSNADISYSAISWNGFNLIGDKKSIKEIERLMYHESRTKALENEISRLNSILSAKAIPFSKRYVK